jgi:hypothetical protein
MREVRNPKSEVRSNERMKPRLLIILAVALAMTCVVFSQVPWSSANGAKLAFTPSGTNEFAFDTGVLKGKLRADGKSTGLSSVVHLPTGTVLDSSMGLMGHYRVFSTNKRYSTSAWFWPSEAKLRPDGSVEARWPSVADRPFELSAVYRWAAPDTLDVETIVQAKTNLTNFESFLASYFSPGFTNACVYVRSNGQARLDEADQSRGAWQAYPRDEKAAAIVQDGRWKFPPNPVDWALGTPLAKPLGVRRAAANNLEAVIMSPPEDCFAVLTPFEADPHRSMYLSLFGRDLKSGEVAHARARLVITGPLAGDAIERLYTDYLRQRQ